MKLDLKISNSRFWIFLSLILTGLFFWSQVYLNYEKNQPLLGHFVTDSNEYYNSAENFFNTGSYSPDVRTPGLGIIFLFFRVLFSKTVTLNLILILQWIASAISAYVLALTMSRILKKDNVFYYVFFISTLTPYLFSWNTFYLTEGFCIPFFIFSIYYLHNFFENDFKKHLFLAGFFVTWCVFLRPVFFLFLGILSIFLLIHFIKKKIHFKTMFTHFLLFLSVFIICDAAWITRNYKEKNKFVLLNDIDAYTVMDPTAHYSTLYTFMQSWGGDLQNQMFWFELELNTDYSTKDTTLPSYIYTSKFNGDSLVLVKERMKAYSHAPKDSLLILANTSLKNFMNSIKEEKPELYYVGSGFIYFKKIILSGYGSLSWSDKKLYGLSNFKKIIKLSLAFFFYILFFTGMMFSLLALFRKNNNFILSLLITIAFTNILFICFYFRVPEFRYLIPSTLVFFCMTGIVLEKVVEAIKQKFTSASQ